MTEYQAWIFISIAATAAIVGCLSIMAACYSIWDNRRIARQKTTLELISSYNSDPRVNEALSIIRKYKEAPVEAFSPLKNQIKPEERIDFLFLMNMFESIAIGLTHDIYDRQMIKDAFSADLRQIHMATQKSNLIDAARVEMPEMPDFLSEYEKLIARL